MRQCPACDRWFRNKQAIRQHLRWCKIYNAEKRGRKYVKCIYCGTEYELSPGEPFECRRCGRGGYYEF